MAAVLGLNAKMYRNTATWAAPTWNEMTNVKDVTQSVETATWDASRRGSKWRQKLATLLDGSVEVSMIYEDGDADYDAVRDAFLNGTLIDIAVMSGNIATSGSEGLRAEMSVTSFSREEPLEEGLMVNFTLEPGFSANDPQWMDVA